MMRTCIGRRAATHTRNANPAGDLSSQARPTPTSTYLRGHSWEQTRPFKLGLQVKQPQSGFAIRASSAPVDGETSTGSSYRTLGPTLRSCVLKEIVLRREFTRAILH